MLDHIFRTKPLHVIVAQEDSQELHRELSLFDLLMLAIGATVGSGVFVTTGDIISRTAGPAAVISWIIAGLVCVLNAFPFMELSTIVPSTGSTYSFAYHTLGELPAMIAAILLTLEFGVAGAGVARSWSLKMENWMAGGDPEHNTQFHWLNLEYANIMAAALQVVCVAILLQGVRFGKYFINAVTAVKVGVVLFIIVAGLAVLQPNNLSPFIPPRNDEANAFGVQGIITGATMAFWGYVGFDEVCCLAAEARNPKKMMPIAVIGGLCGTMFLSVMASFVLSGMTSAEDAVDFSAGFNARHLGWASQFVHAGEIVTMPIVVLICFLGQPRLEYALAVDGLMPKIFAKVNKAGTLWANTLMNGVFFTLVAFVVPFTTLWDIVNFGVLLSFIMCNASLVTVRTSKSSPQTAPKALGAMIVFSLGAAYLYQIGYQTHSSTIALILGVICLVGAIASCLFLAIKCPHEPSSPDNYTAPLVPFMPFLAILADFYLMSQMALLSQLWSLLFVVVGICFYFGYGYSHSEGRTSWMKATQIPSANSLHVGMLSSSQPSPSLPISAMEKPSM